jgi:hypothetical protein
LGKTVGQNNPKTKRLGEMKVLMQLANGFAGDAREIYG